MEIDGGRQKSANQLANAQRDILAQQHEPQPIFCAQCPECSAPLIMTHKGGGWVPSLDAVRGEYLGYVSLADLADTIHTQRRQLVIYGVVLLAGMVFGAAVTALVLLSPTQ